MELHLEREPEADLEVRVERLENTLRALSRETASITVRGPCNACGKCLVFAERDRLYCPVCGHGQIV